MAISLSKGQKIDLTKTNPGLNKVLVGLGWDVNKYDGSEAFDLDASAFLLDAQGKAKNEESFIFYGHLKNGNGSVEHLGDNLTGAGDGDDEQIKLTLLDIPADIDKIDVVVTIYEADVRRQNFGQVSNAYIRVVDEASGAELLRYDLGEDYSVETALVVGSFYRNGNDWKFNAVGAGYSGGLAALCNSYGLDAS